MKIKNNKIVIYGVLIIIIGASFINQISANSDTENISLKHFVRFDTALKAAEKKISDCNKFDYSIFSYKEIYDDNGCIIFYIFNLKPNGYVVVTANTNLPPVIGYSFDSCFGEFNNENVLLKILIADIKIRLENIKLVSEEITKTRNTEWKSIMHMDYKNIIDVKNQNFTITSKDDYLLETHWSQSVPYNNFCPIDLSSGIRSVAGCPAVAMAQIINYHKTTNNIIFKDTDDYYHNYGGNSYLIDDDYETYDFPSFPQLNNYLDILMYHYTEQIPLTDDDKAALVFSCGVAAKQVYNPSGSGTYGVNQAYQAYNRFSFNDISLLNEDDSELYDILQQNIEDGLPAHIAVVNEGWTSGHNMVVDGYNLDDYYHINFGWGGSYDGWYLLPDEIPFDLNIIEGVIVNITNDYAESNLYGDGFLSWIDVKPGSTVNGEFTIKNIGEQGSLLNWNIKDYPSWGTWIFTPDQGEDLSSGETKTIYVEVIVPNEPESEFTGEITIENNEFLDDIFKIEVSLATPKDVKMIKYQQLLQFLINYSNIFPIIKILLGI